jgi:hypothetical protein
MGDMVDFVERVGSGKYLRKLQADLVPEQRYSLRVPMGKSPSVHMFKLKQNVFSSG